MIVSKELIENTNNNIFLLCIVVKNIYISF